MERQPDQSVPGDKQCRAGWASRRADWADIDLKGNTNIAPSPNDLCRRGEGKKKKRKKRKKRQETEGKSHREAFFFSIHFTIEYPYCESRVSN